MARQVFKIVIGKSVDGFFGIQREGLAMNIFLWVELMFAAFGFPADPAKPECSQQRMVVLCAKVTINWMKLSVNLCVAPWEGAHARPPISYDAIPSTPSSSGIPINRETKSSAISNPYIQESQRKIGNAIAMAAYWRRGKSIFGGSKS